MSYVGKVDTGGGESLIGTTLFGRCTTAATTAAKTATIAGLDHVVEGLTVFVQFTNSNRAASPTFQIDGSGLEAKPIFLNGNVRPGTTDKDSWLAGSVLALTYDSAGWQISGWLNTDTNTTYNDATESVHGLMSAADKTRLNRLSVITYSDVPVAAADWVTESTPTYPGYSYKAVLALTNASASYVPTVIFTPQQIQSYNPAPVAVSGAGTVTIYVESKPTAAITIPTIQLVKGAVG